jgi:hypothetical protein
LKDCRPIIPIICERTVFANGQIRGRGEGIRARRPKQTHKFILVEALYDTGRKATQHPTQLEQALLFKIETFSSVHIY